MQNRPIIIGYRLIFGVLPFVATITQFFANATLSGFDAVNFWSFFTNLSNVYAGFILLAGAVMMLKQKRSATFDIFRGAAVLYIFTTGLVFVLFLSNNKLPAFIWVNVIVHYIMPVAMLADWLIVPPIRPIPWSQVMLWLTVPIVYLAYTLIRGRLINWYPYPFFNPSIAGGYIGVAAYTSIIAVTLFCLSLIIARLPNLKLA